LNTTLRYIMFATITVKNTWTCTTLHINSQVAERL